MHNIFHVNVIDRRAPWQTGFNAFLEHFCGRTENINVDNTWSMEQICRGIIQRANRLGVLRLICHGNSGYVELGSGFNAPSIQSFRLLRGHFIGQYPKIEVLACGVLSGTAVSRDRPRGTVDLNAIGHQLMQALADAAQVLVISAYDLQRHYPNGSMAYEGPIHHFRPRPSP